MLLRFLKEDDDGVKGAGGDEDDGDEEAYVAACGFTGEYDELPPAPLLLLPLVCLGSGPCGERKYCGSGLKGGDAEKEEGSEPPEGANLVEEEWCLLLIECWLVLLIECWWCGFKGDEGRRGR